MKLKQKLPNPTTNLEEINKCININRFKWAHTEMTIMKQKQANKETGKMSAFSSRDEYFP